MKPPKASAHYQAHRNDPAFLHKRRAYARAYREQHNDDPRHWVLLRAKQVGCVCCGERAPECLDLHRLAEPQRPLTLRQPDVKRLSAAALERELTGCVCLCSNCRRRYLAGNLGLPHWVPDEHRWHRFR